MYNTADNMAVNSMEDKPYFHYLDGDSEMKSITRAINWRETILGDPLAWPQSLHTTLSIILNSKFPMFLFWGPESICFYNDAYRPSLGKNGKHPAVSMRGEDCWPDIWPVIKPLINQVLSGGESTWSEDQLIPIYRNGQMEDVYWTFSYSPVYDEQTKPAGVFVTCTETTKQVQSLQRVQILFDELSNSNEELGASNEELTSTVEALETSKGTLQVFMKDLVGSQDELNFVLNAAELGTWDLDPATNCFKGNKRLKSWFGLTPLEEIDLPLATNVIDANDRPRVIAAIQEAMLMSSGGRYDITYTIINPKNPVPRIVRAKGKAVFNANQEPIRFSGTLQDITEERRIRDNLTEINHRLEFALDAGKLGSYDLELSTGKMFCTSQCKANFGIDKNAEFNFEDLMVSILPEYRDYVLEQVNKSIAEKGVYQAEYQIKWPDNSLHWISVAGKPSYNKHDEAVKMTGVTFEITERKLDDLRKNDFIGMVSHELKTPLTSMKGYVQMLNNKAKRIEDVFTSNALTKIDTQIVKMTSLINGFLNVSRLESGKIHLELQHFDLSGLLQEVVAEASNVNSTHKIELLSCDAIYVNADMDKIEHVVTNLINNAMKYSQNGTNITIHCEQAGKNARVSIKDEGIGIKEHDKDKLFERYYRVDNPEVKTISGFGIGLYLSAEIIRRHKGKIWVESKYGKGSTFFFMLPVSVT